MGNVFSAGNATQITTPSTTPNTTPEQTMPPVSRISARNGQRVVRGPAWKWENQDGGDGHVGTVIVVEQPWMDEEQAGAPFCVRVLWDNGKIAKYRASRTCDCDLRLFDNGPVGVTFPGIVCDSCAKSNIVGTRWKCSECFDYDLCHTCYMNDKHNLEHAFLRFDEPGGTWVKVPPRIDSTKVQVHGIFQGAKVQRGVYWSWGDQDGGTGTTGTVLSITDWGEGTVRSEARVKWPRDVCSYSYRLGHNAKVDLKCTEPTPGGSFYRDHMPLIAPVKVRTSSETGSPEFCEGDRVAVTLDADCFRNLQEGHGGWNSHMEEIINRLGTVQSVDQKGNVIANFGPITKWTINPVALIKVPVFFPGDMVTIIDDLPKMKKLQDGHGGYVESMRSCVGKSGVVLNVFRTHDVRVLISATAWTFNPICLSLLARRSDGDLSSRMREVATDSGVPEQLVDRLLQMLSRSMRDLQLGGSLPSIFSAGQKVKIISDKHRVKQLQMGHGGYVSYMDNYIGKIGTVEKGDSNGDVHVKFSDGKSWCYNPACVKAVDSSESSSDGDSDSGDEASKGLEDMIHQLLGIESNRGSGSSCAREKLKTPPLHVACFLGNEAVVRMMVATGADLEEEDKDGDKALHYAAYSDKPEIIELLINSGANINAVNKNKVTVLHIAVNKEFVGSVRALVTKFGECLNVNAQNRNGDTPLHVAVMKNSLEIIDMLINAPAIDITVKNERRHTALHHAAIKGNDFAVKRIISKNPDSVDMKDKDGFTALHVAAIASHYGVVKTLLTQGHCSIELKTNKELTALMMAVCKGHCDIVELLVGAGADINAADEDGDTAMHMSLMNRSSVQVQSASPSTAPAMAAIVSQLLETVQPGVDSSLVIACFLANRGADLHRKNNAGLTPLQVASNASVVEQLLIWRTKKREMPTQPTAATTTASADPSDICKICREAAADVWFEPCGHRLYCSECCRRMKCCLSCGVAITGKVKSAEQQADAERQCAQRELEARLKELEDAHSCVICMERHRNVVFLCGHGACDNCAEDLVACHMCRRTITKRIKLY